MLDRGLDPYRRWVVRPLLALVVVIAALALVPPPDASGRGRKKARAAKPTTNLEMGAAAPSIVLKDLDGRFVIHKPAKRRRSGRPSVVSFFATWCEPCKRELPILQRLHDERGGFDLDVFLIGHRQGREELATFLNQAGITIPTLVDRYGKVGDQFGVDSLPRLFVLDGRGRVKAVAKGDKPGLEAFLNKSLDRLM